LGKSFPSYFCYFFYPLFFIFMKNTLMYVLIAVALVALAYKFAYPAAPAADMIAKVGETAKNMASGAVDNAATIAKQAAMDAANKVASGVADAASGAAAVVNTVVDTTLAGSYSIASGSVVKWLGKKVVGSHPGQISLSEGTVTVVAGKVQGGKLVIDMNTIKTLDDA
jgi:hypothetical protein